MRRAIVLVTSVVLTLLISSCNAPQPPMETPPATLKANAALPQGIDPKQTSDDPTYGCSKDNAIKVGGPKGSSGPASERLYLRHLRDAKFRPFRFNRRGSFGAGPDGHIVDGYELTDQDGKKVMIYLDMYHPEIHPFHVKAPKGMYFWK